MSEKIEKLLDKAWEIRDSETIENCYKVPQLVRILERLDTEYRTLSAELAKAREAVADAIRRPMGVIPEAAEGLVTDESLHAAELRRTALAAKGPTNE